MAMDFQVVVLAGGTSKDLAPLVSKELPKALLPVADRPVLSYVLDLLEASNIKDIIVVVEEEDTDAASRIGSWISSAYTDRLNVEVATVPDDVGTAGALRAVAHHLFANDILVVSGDLVTDVPPGAVAATHRRHDAVVTALLCDAPVSGPSETGFSGGKDKSKKPGRHNIVGLDSTKQLLLHVAAGSEVEKDIRIQKSILRSIGQMEVRVDLMDAHLYAFKRIVLQEVLEQKNTFESIQRDVLPYLVRSQLRSEVSAKGIPQEEEGWNGQTASAFQTWTQHNSGTLSAFPDTYLYNSNNSIAVPRTHKCCAYIANKSKYCVRLNSIQAFSDINRDVIGEASHISGYSFSAHSNIIHPSAKHGTKTTIGQHCMISESSQLGDKCNVKRSVIGRHCRIGSNVKIVNSVVMNHVSIEDGCTVQGSVICSNVQLQEGCVLRDCQVGAGYVVTAGSEHKECPWSVRTVYKSSSSASEPEFSGSPTEKAILSWAVKELGMDAEAQKRHWEILHVEAFNSDKKRSGVMARSKEDEHVVNVHWKGAAEMILGMCSHYCNTDGVPRELDAEKRTMAEQIIEGMAASSLRCIAFAYKRQGSVENYCSGNDDGSGEDGVRKLEEEKLTLLGVVGLKDPCRPGARKAVEGCRAAGVAVKMITGDNIFTAKSIAFECGILQADDGGDGAVVEGKTFRSWSEERRMEMVDRIRVMARSSPSDKLLMVQCLKRKHHVVAVTGDGITNDAPALREADVGLSMGVQCTEVMESSDIVILDDNFASVDTVLMWGRCVYNNIQKVIQFQLTMNVAALVISLVAAVSSDKVPLTSVELQIGPFGVNSNLIMETLGVLALATEKPTEDLAKKPPVGRTAPLITNVMLRNLVAQAVFQVVVLLVLQFKGESMFRVGEKVKSTLVFNTFVLCQVFNEFNARRLEKKNVFEGIHKNRLFLGFIAAALIFQVLMVEFVIKRFEDVENLDWRQWGFCVGIASLSWPIDWAFKWVPVGDKPISVTRHGAEQVC